MKSTLTLYKDTKILPSKNLKVESLSTYLAGLTDTKTINDFQYIKSTSLIEFDVKIDDSQVYINNDQLYNYNYAKIVNTDNSRPYYYFITNKVWRSEHCVMLHLVLDSINTFALGTDYILSKKTRVIREHKDRFVALSNYHVTKSIELDSVMNPNDFNVSSLSNTYDSQSGTYETHVDFQISKAILDGLGFSENSSSGTFKIRTLVQIVNKLRGATITFKYPDDCLGVILVDENTYELEFSNINSPITFSFANTNPKRNPVIDIEVTTTFNKLQRKIDLYSEGINPLLYKKELGTLHEDTENTWNLIYKTAQILSEEESNPVDCFLIPENEMLITIPDDGLISVGDLDATKKYYFLYAKNDLVFNNHILEVPGGDRAYQFKLPNDDIVNLTCEHNDAQVTQKYLELYVDNGQLVCRYNIGILGFRLTGELDSANARLIGEVRGASIQILNPEVNIAKCYRADATTSFLDLYYHFELNGQFDLESTTTRLSGIADYDRTQSTLIKIINTPYCPSNYKFNMPAEELIMSDDWEYSFIGGGSSLGEYKLINKNAKFENTITSKLLNPITQAVIINNSVGLLQTRNDLYESKLFHSDFYQIKFVYDSFSYVFALEKLDMTNTNFTEYFRFRFVTTSTINSKFLFIFDDIKYLYATEDYDNVLPVARNNEVVIYNSTYLNYLRTAYNYDLKAKERTIRTGAIGLGLGLIGSATSGALGVLSGNPAMAVSSIMGATSSTTSQIVGYIDSIQKQEEALESKLALLQAESISVAGSDDLDLLKAYSQNKAKLCLYRSSEKMTKALADLFYYTGYATNEMKIPTYNTRKYFNYLAMEIDVLVNSANINDIIMNDIKMRWANGVTILHSYQSQGVALWDFNQQYENWEVSLLS